MRVVVINGALTHIEQLRATCSAFNQTISVSPGLVPAPVDRDDGAGQSNAPLALLFEADEPIGDALRLLDRVRMLPEFASFVRLLAVDAATLENLASIGAFDDFLIAPYTAAELKQRVQASWNRRRVTNNALEESYRLTPELTVDGGGRHAVLGNENIELTAKEHGLLLCLCRSFGRVLSRAELIARVWGNDYAGSPRTVDIHVRRLRSKLGSALPLYTVRGAGYLLKVGQRWEAVADEAAVPPSGVSGVERPLAASTAA